MLWLVVVVLVQIAVAYLGHNLVQAFERWAFPVLAVVFLVGAVVVLGHSDASFVPEGGGTGGLGGFLLTVGAVFGYTAGWTPYAADYSRYLPETVSRRATGLAAGIGIGLSCTVLMIVGAASVSAAALAGVTSDNPTTAYVGVLPGWLAGAHADRDRHRRGGRERPQHLLGGDGVPDDGDPGAPEAGARVRGAGVRGGRVPHRARGARRRGAPATRTSSS